MQQSIIRRADGYKFSHWKQYPPNTAHISSYVEARGGDFAHSVFFGLQMYLQTLTQPITQADIDDADEDLQLYGVPFNREGWQHILDVHGGLLPLEIRAVPEGSVIPVGNVLVTVENTDPACYWLPGHIETSLLRAIWYPVTVASLSFACKQEILAARIASCDAPYDGLDYALHDFGARGVSSAESAEVGGAAHLVNFAGTDTFECLRPIRQIYGERLAGFSVPASEHSTITSWRDGKQTNEIEAYTNMLDHFAKPGHIVAIVSDSYDLWHAVEHIWGGTLKQRVMDSGARIIIRPDSGDPTIVPVQVIEMLADKFGYSINNKGFKVLPDYLRVIQGDGISQCSIRVIFDRLLEAGFSAENIAFGMGGGLLQQINRDTMRFAMKASARCDTDGVWRDVFKSPVDDPGKRSKAGRLSLAIRDGEYVTVPYTTDEANVLRTVFRDGVITRTQTFSDIRRRAHCATMAHAQQR